MIPVFHTTNMISLSEVFLIAKTEAEAISMKDDSNSSGMIALMVFMILIPLGGHDLYRQSEIYDAIL